MTDTLPVTKEDRRAPVAMYLLGKPDDYSPLDDEGLDWLADQLCSDTRVHPDRTRSTGWIPYQAAFEFPHLLDRLSTLRAERDAMREELRGTLQMLERDIEHKAINWQEKHRRVMSIRQALKDNPHD